MMNPREATRNLVQQAGYAISRAVSVMALISSASLIGSIASDWLSLDRLAQALLRVGLALAGGFFATWLSALFGLVLSELYGWIEHRPEDMHLPMTIGFAIFFLSAIVAFWAGIYAGAALSARGAIVAAVSPVAGTFAAAALAGLDFLLYRK